MANYGWNGGFAVWLLLVLSGSAIALSIFSALLTVIAGG